jgi:MFS family permease
MASRLGAGPGTVGLILGAAGLVSTPLTIPTGFLVRRVGSRPVMIWASLGAAGACLGVFLFPTLLGLAAGTVVYEAARMSVILAMQSHVAAVASKGDSSLAFGQFGAAAAVGQALGPILAGLLIDTVGAAGTWAVMGLILAATGVSTRYLIGSGRNASDQESRPPFRIKSFLGVSTLRAISVSFLAVWASTARLAIYPLFLENVGFSATVIGAVLSARAFVSFVARLGTGFFLKFFGGQTRTMIASLFILAVGILTTPLCRDTGLVFLNAAVVGMGFAVAIPLTMAAVADSVTRVDRSVAISVRLMANRFAQVLGPLASGGLAEWIGIPAAIAAVGGLLAGGGLAVAEWWRRRR